MNDYREAYENYYRNINKKTNVNIQEDKSSFWSKNKVKNYRSNNKIEGLVSKEYWIKRVERELAGSAVIIVILFGLKCFPSEGTTSLYIKCKNILNTNLTYDQSVDILKGIEIGTFKGQNFNINGFTFDNLKKENVKKEFIDCMNYIKDNSFKVEEKEI